MLLVSRGRDSETARQQESDRDTAAAAAGGTEALVGSSERGVILLCDFSWER